MLVARCYLSQTDRQTDRQTDATTGDEYRELPTAIITAEGIPAQQDDETRSHL